jgi:hypothetical protein
VIENQHDARIGRDAHVANERDYKSGARTNATMSLRVANLTDQNMRDLAAYFATLLRLPPYHPLDQGPAPAIVAHGAPMRNIPPCAACHGTVAFNIGI